MRWLSAVSGVISGLFLVDMAAYLVTGAGLVPLLIGGEGNPVVLAVAGHLGDMPDWLFVLVCTVSVIVLAAIMCLSVMSSLNPEGCRHER